MVASINKLQQALGYTFSNELLLRQALTHKSFADKNNERLEFLGDSILNCILASILFEKFIQLDEGNLTKLRARLVNKAALYNIAVDLQIADYVVVGQSENTANISKSILADSIESIIAAIYLDSDWDTTYMTVSKWYVKYLSSINLTTNIKDYKTQLQEWTQSHKFALPAYKVIKKTGQDHAPIFTVSCAVERLKKPVIATGSSKNVAQQNAAKLALEQIE